MANDNTFSITIDNFEGLAPAYYSNDWSVYGNKGSANSLKDVDISDPNVLTQGAVKSTSLFNGGFSSTKLVNMRKIICYMLAIILAYLLSTIPYFSGAFVYVVTWFSLREAWSVTENLAEMGLQFPQDLIKKIAGEIKKDESENK